MRVSAIPNFLKINNTQKTSNDYDNRSFYGNKKAAANDVFVKNNASDTVSFTSAARCKLLRYLPVEEIPCMYCGKPMINPEIIDEMKASGILTGPAKKVLPAIKEYYNFLLGIPKEAFKMLNKLSISKPDNDLQQLLELVKTKYEHKLLIQQIPIIQEIKKTGKKLPKDNKELLDMLMQLTKYELHSGNESKLFFTRQKFIDRLNKHVLEGVSDEALVQQIRDIAELLPSTNTSLAAFVVENHKLTSEQIAMNIIAPSKKSVEHLDARCNDPIKTSRMGNYMLAHEGENNMFKDLALIKRIEKKPEIVKNSRKQLRVLKRFANKGMLHPEDIVKTRDKVAELSYGKIDVNLTRLDMEAYNKRVAKEIEERKRIGQQIKVLFQMIEQGKRAKPVVVPARFLRTANPSYTKVIMTSTYSKLIKTEP